MNASFQRTVFWNTFVWRVAEALYTDVSSPRPREGIGRSRLSLGAQLRSTTTCGVAVGQQYGPDFLDCPRLLL